MTETKLLFLLFLILFVKYSWATVLTSIPANNTLRNTEMKSCDKEMLLTKAHVGLKDCEIEEYLNFDESDGLSESEDVYNASSMERKDSDTSESESDDDSVSYENIQKISEDITSAVPSPALEIEIEGWSRLSSPSLKSEISGTSTASGPSSAHDFENEDIHSPFLPPQDVCSTTGRKSRGLSRGRKPRGRARSLSNRRGVTSEAPRGGQVTRGRPAIRGRRLNRGRGARVRARGVSPRPYYDSADWKDVKLTRQRLRVDNVMKYLTIFAKRVWLGFRSYLLGKTKLRKKFVMSDKLKKFMMEFRKKSNKTKIINNNQVLTEVIPLKINEKSRQDAPMWPSSIYQNRGLNQMQSHQNMFGSLRLKWRSQLISEECDVSQPAVVNYVTRLSEIAGTLYKSLNRKPDRWYLWPLKPGDTPSSDYITQYQNLYKLTLAYGTKGTPYFNKKTVLTTIKNGLDFMATTKGYDGKKYHRNWWNFVIGVTDVFTKIMIIIMDELTPKQIKLYLKILLNDFISDPRIIKSFSTNINVGVVSSNLAETILALGILQEDYNAVKMSTEIVTEVLNPNSKKLKSFYPDGSFVYDDIPYNGLYGQELVKSVAQIMFITKGSKFELDTNLTQSLADIIQRAFLPLIHNGEMMAMVSGRAISRAPPDSKVGYGSTLLFDLLIASETAPIASQRTLQEMVKYWMRKNPEYYLTNTRNYNDIIMMTKLLNNDSIIGDELPFYGVKHYGSMDRFVQQTPDYMLGLALHSSRIAAFDSGNAENKRGWHTADGMVYLYNDDEVQFNSAYWPTVDPYRLPGTTVDTVNLLDEVLSSSTTSKEKWVGGVANNYQAVIGMSLNKTGTRNQGKLLKMDLRAKKSWFIVEGQIVALGTDITGSTTSSIETIVDNRLLSDKLKYLLLSSNGVVIDPAGYAADKLFVNRKTQLKNINWLLLEESSHKASIGYYFPNKETINLICERRSGTYFDINEKYLSTHTFAGNYSKILINHGKLPNNTSYAYVMLPGISKHELEEYIEANPVIILANTQDIQAVKIKDRDYIGINIWNEFGGEIADISSDKPVSILKQSVKNIVDTYVISDPTQSNSIVRVKIPEFTKILQMSKGVEYDAEYNDFVINFENKNGASQLITVTGIWSFS